MTPGAALARELPEFVRRSTGTSWCSGSVVRSAAPNPVVRVLISMLRVHEVAEFSPREATPAGATLFLTRLVVCLIVPRGNATPH